MCYPLLAYSPAFIGWLASEGPLDRGGQASDVFQCQQRLRRPSVGVQFEVLAPRMRPAGCLVDPAGGLQRLKAPHAVGLQDVGKVLQMSLGR